MNFIFIILKGLLKTKREHESACGRFPAAHLGEKHREMGLTAKDPYRELWRFEK